MAYSSSFNLNIRKTTTGRRKACPYAGYGNILSKQDISFFCIHHHFFFCDVLVAANVHFTTAQGLPKDQKNEMSFK